MNTSSVGLSACIIAFNEEDRIAQCIRSVSFCDEIVVVDSHSSDATQTIARQLGAVVIVQDWLGYGKQKEFAVRAARNEWVLCIDADEHVSEPLKQEIIEQQSKGFATTVGYSMPRLTKYKGAWIRHGTWYPDRAVRLFDRRHGSWSASRVHEHVVLDAAPTMLYNDLLHEGYRSHAEHMAKTRVYAALMAEEMRSNGLRAGITDVTLRSPLAFLRTYILRQGFLDGWRGLQIAFHTARYTQMKYNKLLELQRHG